MDFEKLAGDLLGIMKAAAPLVGREGASVTTEPTERSIPPPPETMTISWASASMPMGIRLIVAKAR